MKILHTVQSYLPEHNGMQKVVQELSELLVANGHEVIVATYGVSGTADVINGVTVLHFDCSGNEVSGIKGEMEKYRSYVMKQDYDIIVNFAAQQWATDAILQDLDKIKKPKVFVPTGFSALYDLNYAGYFSRMKEWMNIYDMNVFHSHGYRDIKWARENGITRIVTIPNGASEEEFDIPNDPYTRKRYGIPDTHFVILLVGSHTGQKGHREAIEIFKQADTGPSTLVIAGEPTGMRCTTKCQLESFISSREKRIVSISPCRNEIIALYHTADAFLFPSNIEAAPLVLYEAMASKLPFLTTDVGNATEIVSESDCAGFVLPTTFDKNGFSHADVKASTEALELMYNNPVERKRLGERGYAVWKQKFTWKRIAQQYEQLYERLVKDTK